LLIAFEFSFAQLNTLQITIAKYIQYNSCLTRQLACFSVLDKKHGEASSQHDQHYLIIIIIIIIVVL